MLGEDFDMGEVTEVVKQYIESAGKAIDRARTLEMLLTKIAWIMTNIDNEDEKLARIQELIGWWAMYQAGGLNLDTLSTYLEEPHAD